MNISPNTFAASVSSAHAQHHDARPGRKRDRERTVRRFCRSFAAAAALFAFCCEAQGARSLLADGTLVAGRCDRACMIELLDDYLRATVAHDPQQVLWSTMPRYTEDGTSMPPGQSLLWNTTTAVGRYKNYFVDPTAGQVGLLGVVYRGALPMLIGMRLKLVGRRVSETEVLTVAKQGAAEALEAKGAPPAIFQEFIAPRRRATRQQLIAAADAYFTGIEQSNGDMVPFADGCNRIENGGQTTNLRDLSMAPFDGPDAASWRSHFSQGCRDQLNSGMFGYITELRNRRYEVVDEEKGNVLSFVIFDHAGDVRSIQLPGQPLISLPAMLLHPFDTYVAEAFHIRDGKIQQIEAAIHGGKLAMDSGWPDR